MTVFTRKIWIFFWHQCFVPPLSRLRRVPDPRGELRLRHAGAGRLSLPLRPRQALLVQVHQGLHDAAGHLRLAGIQTSFRCVLQQHRTCSKKGTRTLRVSDVCTIKNCTFFVLASSINVETIEQRGQKKSCQFLVVSHKKSVQYFCCSCPSMIVKDTMNQIQKDQEKNLCMWQNHLF